jgi:trimethylamine:corrinoid methyltransferase-like protein
MKSFMKGQLDNAWPMQGPEFLVGRETLDRMHEAAVTMIERTGIQVEHAGVREAIAGRAGFSLADGRVRIARAKVEAYVAEMRAQAAPVPVRDPDKPLSLGVDTRASYIVGRDGTTLRPMTRQDVVDSAKLVTMLGDRGVHGSTTGLPMDVPQALIPLEQFMISAQYSRGGGETNDVTDIPTSEAIRDMNRVYGRGFGRSVWNPSPMILGGGELDILWHFRDSVESVFVGSMPIMGVTGPCDPIGVFTLGVAECLGGAVILKELLPKAWVMIGPHPEPADMGSGVMVFGTPEWEILDVMHRDVHGYYGFRWDGKMIHTTASVPGPQAAADHAGSMMLGASYGYTSFSPGGMLALDEVYSPAQLVIDADILAHTGRIGRGAWSGEGLELDQLPGVVAEVIATGEAFITHDTTAANMRAQYHAPKVLKRRNRVQWEAAGRPDEVATAQAEADRLVAAFDYEPPAVILKELRAIYERAKQRF